MLADDVIAGVGGEADQLFHGGIRALADDLRRAARFDLTPGVMMSARTVHVSPVEARVRALPLCRLPFQRTWFEWPGGAGAPPKEHSIVGPARYAPVPRRCGALVTVDESRQRGTMTWAWFTKQTDEVNMCPLSVTFDWREEPEPLDDLQEQALRRYGISKEEANDRMYAADIRQLPRLRGQPRVVMEADRDRFGFIWSPYVSSFADDYTRRSGPLDPTHRLWAAAIGDITGEPGLLRCVILLLNSRNMTAAEAVPAPAKLNKARAQKGKQPLLDYTTIRIRLSRAMATRAGSVDERSPSRFHVVRGHFKVRKTGIYWWNDFGRGDPTQGAVRQQTRKVIA
jgi:hypothetical protein